MTYSKSILGYLDCKNTFDQAVASPHGLRLTYEGPSAYAQALTFRGRMNKFRALDRADNTKIYPEDDPMHGRSVYDVFAIKLLKNDTSSVLLIERLSMPRAKIEELTPEDTSSHTGRDA